MQRAKNGDAAAEAQLKALVRMIEDKEADIRDALNADLAKRRMESYLHEHAIGSRNPNSSTYFLPDTLPLLDANIEDRT